MKPERQIPDSPASNAAAALDEARRLLAAAWAAGLKDGLHRQTDNLSLPQEVRAFAGDIASAAHLKAARNLPRVILQIGRFAITVSRPNANVEPSGKAAPNAE
jgi:hypothetical protein